MIATSQVELVSEEDLLRSLSMLEALAAGDPGENMLKSDRSSGEKEQEGNEDPDEDEDEDKGKDKDKGKDEDDDPDDDEDDAMQKSLQGQIVGDSETMRKAIEVSDFLEGIVEGMSRVMAGALVRLDQMEKSLAALTKTQRVSNEVMAKSLRGIHDHQKSLGRLATGSRKSITSTTVLEKSFVGNDGDSGDKFASMSKTQKAELLTDLLMKGHNGITAGDIVNVESSGNIPPHLVEVLRKAL